jgi:hypothetical protein
LVCFIKNGTNFKNGDNILSTIVWVRHCKKKHKWISKAIILCLSDRKR